jgi:hypothetical protein
VVPGLRLHYPSTIVQVLFRTAIHPQSSSVKTVVAGATAIYLLLLEFIVKLSMISHKKFNKYSNAKVMFDLIKKDRRNTHAIIPDQDNLMGHHVIFN